jgi:hypothetical protein
MGELGLAFIKLTKFESEEATFDSQRTRAADMKKLATAAVKASRLYRELNAQTVKHLVRNFHLLWHFICYSKAFRLFFFSIYGTLNSSPNFDFAQIYFKAQ